MRSTTRKLFSNAGALMERPFVLVVHAAPAIREALLLRTTSPAPRESVVCSRSSMVS